MNVVNIGKGPSLESRRRTGPDWKAAKIIVPLSLAPMLKLLKAIAGHESQVMGTEEAALGDRLIQINF